MRIGDVEFFAPTKKYHEIDLKKPKELVQAFYERVISYYFEPIKKLNKEQEAFAAGVLCATTIDLLAKMKFHPQRGGNRYVNWLRSEIDPFLEIDPNDPKQTLADLFYKEFRCGLVHEGRITGLGQFSYMIGGLIYVEGEIIVVNPKKLFESIEVAFKRYIMNLDNDQSEIDRFMKIIETDYAEEINYAKQKEEGE